MKNLFTILCILSGLSAAALNSAHFSVQRITSPYFVVDGNSPASGPTSAYVGFKVTNQSSLTTYTNMLLTINSINTNVAGQDYIISSPASGIVTVGTLAPGESKVCYFYVKYPASTTPQATFNYTLSDNTAGNKTGSFVIANRSAISANAGGLATQSINSQDLIGGIVYDDVTYTLGNIRNGDEADFQVSVSTQFSPTKLQLLKTQVVASTVPGVIVNTVDQLYFTTTANQSSGTVTIRWTFRIADFNFTSLILPYAGATSGASNYKYAISTDLGSGTPITVSGSANPLLITKTSDKVTYGPGNIAIFTTTIQNPRSFPVTIDRITDQLPAGFSYVGLDIASQITILNSSSIPVIGATGTITFSGGVVTGGNISYVVPANGSLQLKYTAISPLSTASNLQATVAGYIGVTQFGSAQVTVNVSTTLPVVLTRFTGNWMDDYARLEWISETESNSSHFEIERSANNADFKKIGEIKTGRMNYIFIDSVPSDRNYYRLKMVDMDGQAKYTGIVTLHKNAAAFLVASVYPNPFQNSIQLSVRIKNEQVVGIEILDNTGNVQLRQNSRMTRGTNSIDIHNIQVLPAGFYFLRIKADGMVFNKMIVKQ